MTVRRFPAPEDGAPSSAMQTAFAEDGFLVLEGFASASDCAQLMARADELVAAFAPGDQLTVFSSSSRAHDRTRYFEESGDKVRFFFEEGAVDEAGQLTVPKGRAVNKIGHALHDLDPVFSAFSRTPELAAVAAGLGVAEPLLLQSMVIFKQPGIGGEVRWHQDASYLIADPPGVTGIWIAIEDATRNNGCLWMQPGQHRSPLREIYQVDWRTRSGTLSKLDDTVWTAGEATAMEVPAGSAVFFNDHMPHSSSQNHSDLSRQAFTMHVSETDAVWSEKNWLQRPDLGVFEL